MAVSESVRLVDVVRTYVGDELSWDLQLVLHRDHAESTRLGGRAQLGMNTWLLSRPLDRDPSDVVLEPTKHVA